MDTPTTSPASLLRKLVKKDPIPCEVLGNHWLHPVGIIDQFALDAVVGEVAKKIGDLVDSDKDRDIYITQAITIGTIWLSLKEGPDKNSANVYSSFEEAYNNLRSKPDIVVKIFGAHSEAFDLTPVEKKTSQPAGSLKTT